MNPDLELRGSDGGTCTVGIVGGGALWSYCFEPGTPVGESPRPFIHPLYSIDGDVLSNWRPNDHPWHHGLSFTLSAVNALNFWGGPSHRAEDGYRWRGDHGRQRHAGWRRLQPDEVAHTVQWIDPRPGGRVLIEEERTLATGLVDGGWTLRWTSRVRNVTGGELVCHNYHSLGGLAGSHYSGLQFRGARGLLDEHGDDTIGLRGEGGARAVEAVHGQAARWLEWHTQHDGSLRRTRVRFESLSGDIPWFVRPQDPLVAFAPHREEPLCLAAGSIREFDHLLHFLRA